MNHVYRVIWNGSATCWQAVSETARGKSKSSKLASKPSSKMLKPVLIAASIAVSGISTAAPVGGVVASGTASIGTSGSTTTINQSTAKAIINWNDFSIANGETVNFVQPDANAIALNRVVTATPSSIQGALNANGQVFIVNPNGITFGSTAQVNVGGLVASTLAITDSDFNGGTYRFNGSSSAGITNQGAIAVANTGTAALIAPSIQQAGSIVNNDGSILLTAASDVTLSLTNRVLNSQTINAGYNTATINNSAGTLQADGGKVILTAQGVNSSSTASISSAGTIRAQTLASNDRGAIDLISDMSSGTVNLTGTLDASAPTNGFGGTIKTHGATVTVADSAAVTTRKVNQTNLPGTSSYWQIRTNNITVGAGGTISGSELSSSLNDGSVTLTSVGTGTNQGTININDAVSTNSNVILNMAAINDINFNNNVGLTANLGRLVLSYGASKDYNLNNGSKITLSGAGATLRINSTDYTVVNSLGVAGDTTSTTLQGIKNNLTGNYALGSDIDASATSGWNSGKGFDPIGSIGTILTISTDPNSPSGYALSSSQTDNPFTGQFHGLGHRVNQLTINRPMAAIDFSNPVGTYHVLGVGLFGATSNIIRNIHIMGGSITGSSGVGGLIGIQKTGSVLHVSSSASIAGGSNLGGLVGSSGYLDRTTGTTYRGLIVDASATGDIQLLGNGPSQSSGSYLGGLVGQSYSTIKNSHASGNINLVTGTSASGVGGLVGEQNDQSIINSYAEGHISGDIDWAGGLAGAFRVNGTTDAEISQSHATGNVTATRSAGGLVGIVTKSADDSVLVSIKDSYATGNVSTTQATINSTGGLIGNIWASSTLVKNSYAVGNVNGTVNSGGLIGAIYSSVEVDNSHATGTVTGTTEVGGLVGMSQSYANLHDSYATGSVQGTTNVGGLLGLSTANVSNNYSTGAVYGTENVGGLIGKTYGGTHFEGGSYGNISNNYSDSDVTGSADSINIGGLVGRNAAHISNSYATGDVSGNDSVGGLAGFNEVAIWGGAIADSYATGAVLGNTKVGGLVGFNSGGVGQSYATGNVQGIQDVGGLIGTENEISASVYNTFATGDVSGAVNVGGLIGHIPDTHGVASTAGAANNYASGLVTGGSYVGGLVGRSDSRGYGIGNSYWNIETSGQINAIGGGFQTSYSNAGKTTAELKQIATFGGWDIADVSNTTSTSVWVIDENNSTPWLR